MGILAAEAALKWLKGYEKKKKILIIVESVVSQNLITTAGILERLTSV